MASAIIASRCYACSSSIRSRAATAKIRLPCAGFTLLEMMVVIVIISIGALMTVPYSHEEIRKLNITLDARNISKAFQYLRSEAIKDGAEITFCPPNAILTQCDTNASFQQGWIALSLPFNAPSLSSYSPTLIHNKPLKSNIKIEMGRKKILFNQMGGVKESIHLWICDEKEVWPAKRITLNMLGRVRVLGGQPKDACRA
jgi:type IV fimbrial biogenesis protein FimT